MTCVMQRIDLSVLRADNGKLGAVVSATTDDSASPVNETLANNKTESAGPPARPQPPVCFMLSVVSSD